MPLNFPKIFQTPVTARAPQTSMQRRAQGMRERLSAIAMHVFAAFAPVRGTPEKDEFETQLQDWVDAGGALLENRAEAAQRIKDARKKKRLTLDLSSLGLTTLPDCIGKLPKLKTLRLNDNELTNLPESVNNIFTVNVTGNPLPDDLDSSTAAASDRTRSQQRLIVNL